MAEAAALAGDQRDVVVYGLLASEWFTKGLFAEAIPVTSRFKATAAELPVGV